ncbi:MAG: hypothetical protein J7K85_07800 [Anaerolineaceae bacterium]|nr:hypothetical protein [Anaerolineaceae bacterium]
MQKPNRTLLHFSLSLEENRNQVSSMIFHRSNAKLTGRQQCGGKPSKNYNIYAEDSVFKKRTAVGGRVERLVSPFIY